MKKNGQTSSQWPVRKISLELQQKQNTEKYRIQSCRRASLFYA